MKGQTILIQTRSKDEGMKEINALEIAFQLSSYVSTLEEDARSPAGKFCESRKTPMGKGKGKFDSKSGLWYDKSVLVLARPGSGKTWMMQQIAHFMCECHLNDKEGAYKFVPVLFSVQRIARLHRASGVTIGGEEESNEITNQTDALQFLEVMLKWDYDDTTVRALLDCYNTRTLVILLDGLDEASSLARMFETLGIFLAKSGNRVVMAGRPEGVASEEFYSESPGWTLLDLPELSVDQQKAIANHQIKNIEGPFFDHFYAYQECRNALDAAAEECGIDMGSRRKDEAFNDDSDIDFVNGADELHGALSNIDCTEIEMAPKTMLCCNVLAEVESTFNDEEVFVPGKKTVILKSEHSVVLDFMTKAYEQAKLAKAQLELILDEVVRASQLDLDTGETNIVDVEINLKKPKQLLQGARRNGGFHNVTDVVQGSIVCDDWKGVTHLLNQMTSNVSVAIHNIHNGFIDPDFIGYRCLTIKMSIKVPTSEFSFNHSIKLQLHLKAMHSLLPSCEVPRAFFLEQDGLCGDEAQRMSGLKKCMDVVHALGRTPVLLSVFLMYIKACTRKLSGEERDHTANVQTCPPMPSSLHFMYQEAMWGTLEVQENDPSTLLKTLQRIAWDNMNNGE